MSKKTNTRIKTEAAAVVCQNELQANAYIEQIGDAQRRRDELTTAMNEEIARIKADHEEKAYPYAEIIREFSDAVRIYCEANRDRLTKDGKTKTFKFAAGEISWRIRPPRVRITGEGVVLKTLQALGLDRFIRVKEEINKEAILAEPAAVEGVKGIAISQGEDFVIKPYATELEEVRP